MNKGAIYSIQLSESQSQLVGVSRRWKRLLIVHKIIYFFQIDHDSYLMTKLSLFSFLKFVNICRMKIVLVEYSKFLILSSIYIKSSE